MERMMGGGVVALIVGMLLISVSRLSSDAAGMAVGLIFGMLAGVPAALLTLYAVRQGQRPAPEPPRIIIVQTPAQLPAPAQSEYIDMTPVIKIRDARSRSGGTDRLLG